MLPGVDAPVRFKSLALGGAGLLRYGMGFAGRSNRSNCLSLIVEQPEAALFFERLNADASAE
jgi:hypothetical protein